MSFWNRLKYLWPPNRRREELEMREELAALESMAERGELGNLTLAMENTRSLWGWTWIESLLADIRYAFRSLRHQPAFVVVAVFSLALAIGANSAIFSLADALLLRPMPVPNPTGVLDVSYTTPDNAFEGMSFPDYRDFRDQSRSFRGLIAYRLTQLAVASDPKLPARIQFALVVTGNFFPVLDVEPAAGRGFQDDEASVPNHAVAMISYDFWRQDYFANPAAIGSTIHLNGVPFTIIGVTPKGFTGLDRFIQPNIFVPIGMTAALAGDTADPFEDRARHDLIVKGRLKPGVSRLEAQAELETIGKALEREYPKTNHNRKSLVRTELDRRIRQTPQILALIKMLMGLVALILVIACSNLANLLLARAGARGREIATRLSIGAGRWRLVRQLMTESLVLAALGCAVGLAFAYGGIVLLQTLSVPSDPPSYLGVELDWRIVEFSLLAAVLSCVFFGLVPAWKATRVDFVSALKAGGHGVSGERRTLGRDALVVGQIALAMVVLITAGMFLAGFERMLVTRPDFQTDRLISMDTGPALIHYSADQTKTFYRDLMNRVRTIPGVESAAMTEAIPLSPAQTVMTVAPEGYQFRKGREKVVEFGAAVDANYFATLGVPIERGRSFTNDDRAGTRRVAIVNQQFAKTYWPNQDPIGKRIHLDMPDGPLAEVVGVVKTLHYLIVNEAPAPYIYVPYEQNPRKRMTLLVRSTGDPASMAGLLRNAVRTLDPNLPVYNLRTVSALYDSRATGTYMQFFQMVGAMGFIGLALATTGLYGLLAYTVNRRVKELGIRVALGAARRDVLWLVERRGLTLGVIGIVAGGILTAAAAPMLNAGFLGLGALSPVVCTIVPLMLIAISLVASYLPARRASKLDPVRALRNE